MRPDPTPFVVWLLIACLAGGCATPGGTNNPAIQTERSGAKDSPHGFANKAFSKSKDSKAAKADQATDKTGLAKSATGDKVAPKTEDVAKTLADSNADKAAGGHSATTMALIQSELRDANPAEREEVMKSLEGVSDEMVPKILNVRRLTLQRKQRDETVAKTYDPNAPKQPIIQASADSKNPFADASADPSRAAPQSGLGTRTPWNQGRTWQEGNAPVRPIGGPTPPADVASQHQPRDRAAADARAAALGFNTGAPANSPPASPNLDNAVASVGPVGVPVGAAPAIRDYTPSAATTPGAMERSRDFSGNQSAAYPPPNMQQGANPGQPQGANPISLGQPTTYADPSRGMPPQNYPPNQNQLQSQQTYPIVTPNTVSMTAGQGPPIHHPGGVIVAAGTNPAVLGQLTPGQYGSPQNGNGAANANGAARTPADLSRPNTPPGTPAMPGMSGFNPPTGFDAAAINQAAYAQGNGWPEYLQRVTALTESEVAQLTPGKTEPEKQRYIEKHVYLRMLYMMAGQQERALQYIPALEPADQEFWQQMFWGMANYFDSREIPNSADRATQTIQQINQAVLKLKDKAHLELRNVAFCHKISSFGDYERFPRDEFAPGQPVLLYAELGNFHSELTADGRYRTMLKSTLELHKPGPQGELIQAIPYPATEDLCRNHRRDYFHSYTFIVPQKTLPGPYVLKLAVEDQLSQKVATYSLNFTVK